ncbi:MAG: apolipoprotein N-acyltransferase [Candidatus Omnitrophota bacterium]|nr:apolipoprotein N-acyltransferase [Candidatus Omnitrophota bacterium]
MPLLILSAILLILSFPNFNLSFFAYIGFVPLFFAIENKSPKKAFFISYVFGFIFYLGTLYWLYHVTTVGLISLCLYLALYFGAFGFILRARSRRINWIALDSAPSASRLSSSINFLLIPVIWVILEYIQANIPIMGFGWALLGYSQYRNLPLIQIADFSGVYGVSFVIMMVNVAIWHVIARLRVRFAQRKLHSWSNPVKKVASSSFGLLAATGLVLMAVYSYGFFKLNENHESDSIKISVVQGNIPQELKWDPEAQDMIIEKYAALTKMAALDNPDLIVWPETSFPGFFEIDKDLTDKVLSLAREIKIPLLLGVNTEKDEKYFNSAALVSEDGRMTDKYDKIHLVPFGEYVPFSNRFSALHKLVLGELGEFTPGKEFKSFSLQPLAFSQAVKFSALICFEDIFPEISKEFVKNGARFLVVITNDAWYGRSGAAYQHAACSVFRAIENRVPVVRCANTGYSCFIDPRGRIYDSVEEKSTNLFISGYKTSTCRF